MRYIFPDVIKFSSLSEIQLVSPAYGDFALALVMHSNEGGPGPRHNMKEDPESSTLIMLKEHGCHLYLMPRFSEAGDNRNRRMGLPPKEFIIKMEGNTAEFSDISGSEIH